METELKTLVEFIYHQSDDSGGIEILFPQMVAHTSRSTDNDGGMNAFHCPVFFHSRASAIAAHSLKGCSHRLEHSFYLQSQFA